MGYESATASTRCSLTQLRARGCALVQNESSGKATSPALHIAFAWPRLACLHQRYTRSHRDDSTNRPRPRFAAFVGIDWADKKHDVCLQIPGSGADLTGSCIGTLTKPIAYYASQASQDGTGTPLPTSGRVKQAEFAAVNGCTPEPSATTFPASGQPHTCTTYTGCSAGHPTLYCVFNGAYGWEPRDPGQPMSWDAPEAWKFIMQF